MLSAIQRSVNKGYLSKIAEAWNQTVYLFMLQETVSVWVALSTCRALWCLNFSFLSHIKRTQDWSVLPFHKVGILGRSVLQSPSIPPLLLCPFKARNGTLFIVREKLAESSSQRNQPSNFQLLLLPDGFRPTFPSRCQIPADKKEEKGKKEKWATGKDLVACHVRTAHLSPQGALWILAHMVQMKHGLSLHLGNLLCAGYCCRAVRSTHAVEGIFGKQQPAGGWTEGMEIPVLFWSKLNFR